MLSLKMYWREECHKIGAKSIIVIEKGGEKDGQTINIRVFFPKSPNRNKYQKLTAAYNQEMSVPIFSRRARKNRRDPKINWLPYPSELLAVYFKCRLPQIVLFYTRSFAFFLQTDSPRHFLIVRLRFGLADIASYGYRAMLVIVS